MKSASFESDQATPVAWSDPKLADFIRHMIAKVVRTLYRVAPRAAWPDPELADFIGKLTAKVVRTLYRGSPGGYSIKCSNYFGNHTPYEIS